MKTTTLLGLLLVAVTLASTLRADDTAIKNTDEWLKTQTSLNESLCRTEWFAVKASAARVGKMKLVISTGKFDGQPCYGVSATVSLVTSTNGRHEMHYEVWTRADLTPLWAKFDTSEDGVKGEDTSHLLRGGKYLIVSRKNNETKVIEVEAKPRTSLQGLEMLLLRLLPRDEEKSFEFNELDSGGEYTVGTITVVGKEDMKDVKTTKFKLHGYTTHKDPGTGEKTSAENTWLAWVDTLRRIHRMEKPSLNLVLELSKENDLENDWPTIEECKTAADAVLTWHYAHSRKDVALIKQCTNGRRMAEAAADRYSKDKNWTAQQRANVLDKLEEYFLKPNEEYQKMAGAIELMSAENFGVSDMADGKAEVRLKSDHSDPSTELVWVVERDEKRQWRIVDLDTRQLKPKNAEPETKPESK